MLLPRDADAIIAATLSPKTYAADAAAMAPAFALFIMLISDFALLSAMRSAARAAQRALRHYAADALLFRCF